MNLKAPIELVDFEPKTGNILKEVLAGLSKSQKTIHPKFLYDKKGSEFFEKICSLEEYYPTRSELQILKKNAKEISKIIGPEALVIEPGSGSGEKVRFLLPHLQYPVGYVPVEISKEALIQMTEELQEEYPWLHVLPVCADFTQDLELPLTIEFRKGKKVLFFPGSTIGNLHPDEAILFLKRYGKMLNSGGGLLIGVDVKKDKRIIERAYNDSAGITAAFNLNLLERLNREVSASFDIKSFEHEAFYNEELGRVEMHLKSKIPQLVRVNQTVFRFHEGETIHTESSYKYSVEEFCELCAKAKFKIRKFWQDPEKLFCVYYFEKE
ncbi:MAG: L-histidine N(alpha)-methyltransferase [Bacteriovoracia bacterium]